MAERTDASHRPRSAGASLRSGSLRAQAALEVLFYIGLFLLLFTVMGLLLSLQIGADARQMEYTMARSAAGQAADLFELGLLAGPGFDGNFTLSPTIAGRPYELWVTNSSSVYVATFNRDGSLSDQFYYPLSTRRVELGCAPGVDCPQGDSVLVYTSGGQRLTRITLNASKGWVRIVNAPDPRNQSVLRLT